jgi:hypothetical protein
LESLTGFSIKPTHLLAIQSVSQLMGNKSSRVHKEQESPKVKVADGVDGIDLLDAKSPRRVDCCEIEVKLIEAVALSPTNSTTSEVVSTDAPPVDKSIDFMVAPAPELVSVVDSFSAFNERLFEEAYATWKSNDKMYIEIQVEQGVSAVPCTLVDMSLDENTITVMGQPARCLVLKWIEKEGKFTIKSDSESKSIGSTAFVYQMSEIFGKRAHSQSEDKDAILVAAADRVQDYKRHIISHFEEWASRYQTLTGVKTSVRLASLEKMGHWSYRFDSLNQFDSWLEQKNKLDGGYQFSLDISIDIDIWYFGCMVITIYTVPPVLAKEEPIKETDAKIKGKKRKGEETKVKASTPSPSKLELPPMVELAALGPVISEIARATRATSKNTRKTRAKRAKV